MTQSLGPKTNEPIQPGSVAIPGWQIAQDAIATPSVLKSIMGSIDRSIEELLREVEKTGAVLSEDLAGDALFQVHPKPIHRLAAPWVCALFVRVVRPPEQCLRSCEVQ